MGKKIEFYFGSDTNSYPFNLPKWQPVKCMNDFLKVIWFSS